MAKPFRSEQIWSSYEWFLISLEVSACKRGRRQIWERNLILESQCILFVSRSAILADLELKIIIYSEIDIPPLPSNAMVATRRGDEDPERVFRVGTPAVTAQFLRELRSVSAPRKRISPPNDTSDEVETTTDGSPPSSLVNNCCLMYRVIQNDCRGTIVQRQFCTKFGKQPPSDNSIRRWYAQFQETGCVCILELKVGIRTAIETITADMRNELDYRVDVCRLTKGAHLVHL